METRFFTVEQDQQPEDCPMGKRWDVRTPDGKWLGMWPPRTGRVGRFLHREDAQAEADRLNVQFAFDTQEVAR